MGVYLDKSTLTIRLIWMSGDMTEGGTSSTFYDIIMGKHVGLP